MGPGRVVARLAAADAALVVRLNALARASGLGRTVAARSATWLAGVEVVLMGTLALAGRGRSAGRMLAGVALVYVVSEAFGRLWRRERPFGEHPHIDVLVPHTRQRSFPSRHVASGLAMATIGGRAHALLGVAMSATAWLLGLSRVASGLHYPSDVLAGAALGMGIGRLLRE